MVEGILWGLALAAIGIAVGLGVWDLFQRPVGNYDEHRVRRSRQAAIVGIGLLAFAFVCVVAQGWLR